MQENLVSLEEVCFRAQHDGSAAQLLKRKAACLIMRSRQGKWLSIAFQHLEHIT